MSAPGLASGVDNTSEPGVPHLLSAAEIDYPPFSIVDAEGRAGGFSVELLRAALAVMGREVTFRTGPWSEVMGWCEQGEVQALPLVGRTPEREALFDFTFPYMSMHGAIVVRDDETDIHSLNDLRGGRVAVMQGDNAEEFLRREDRGIEIHTTATFEQALSELSDGRHDAVIIQRLVALRLITEAGLANLRIVNRPIGGFRQDFCFAVREGDRDTLALLNEGLSLVIAGGTYRHLHAKWFAALELPSHRRIVVGGDDNYPPYEYLDENGRPAGYNVDLTRAIAREVGLEIEIRLAPWAQIVRALEEGEIDVLQGMFYSPERDQKFDFSQPHAVNHHVSVVRSSEGAPPSTLDELEGKQIVVQRGDIMHDFVLENGLGDQVIAVDDQEQALREVSRGKYDCALVSRMVAQHCLDRNRWSNLVAGKKSFSSQEYCYAVLKGQGAILASFSEGLQAIKETGEYRRIHDKWKGVYDDHLLSFASILRYVAMVLAPVLLVLTVVLLWSWSLRKQVAKRTEELRQSDVRYRRLYETMAQGVVYQDTEGRLIHANPAAERMLGLSLEEMLHKTSYDSDWHLIREDGSPLAGSEHPAMVAVRSGKPVEQYALGVMNPQTKKHVWISVSAIPLFQPGDTTPFQVYSTFEDITGRRQAEAEREKLQAQLLQAQKMESVGRLAGGVAHDFNNMLQAILGYSELSLQTVQPDSPLHKNLVEIQNAARRSADLTRQLLAFARKQTINTRVLDLNETVEGMLRMLRRLIGEDIDLAWLPGRNLWPVNMDPSQIDQMLANLCINARDAIPGVGKVTIETGNTTFDEAYCADHVDSLPGEYVLLAVSDNGCGMDRETVTHIFEPFFTTKDVGEGTGLGLATVYGIVKQNGGFINVYSEPGHGTTFRMYLPRHIGVPEQVNKDSTDETCAGGAETILLVEDEQVILDLTKTILVRQGYTVLTAAAPDEAIRLAEAHAGKIHLLITDVVMPGMNGRDLAGKLGTLYPDLTCLFMSGYTANVIAHHGVLDPGVHFIQKPFSLQDIAAKVREALDRQA